MNTVGFLITARLKSTRLPMKLLAKIGEHEIIRHVIRRAKSIAGIDRVVLCTSPHIQDLPLIEIAKEEGIYYFFGSEADVLDRLGQAASTFGLDAFISMTADCPVFCTYHATRVADLLRRDESVDYVYIPDLPIGTAVYGLNTCAVRAACELKTEVDTEIWGPFINHPKFFSVHPLQATPGFQIPARLTIDHPEDYFFMLALASHFKGDFSSLTLPDIGRIIQAHPELTHINSGIIQRKASEELLATLEAFFANNEARIREIIKRHKKS